jgi:putative transcriptional regulator
VVDGGGDRARPKFGRRERDVYLIVAHMTIIVQLDIMLARRKVKSKDLAEHVGITEANMSLLKQGKVKGIRFDTLEKICDFLDCQPGDLLVYSRDRERNTAMEAT